MKKIIDFIKIHKIESLAASFILALIFVYLVNSLIVYKYSSIEKVVSKEKNDVSIKLEEQKDEVKEFKESQNKKVELAKQILKNNTYEKPKIKPASYNAMLDSLWIAQPDK